MSDRTQTLSDLERFEFEQAADESAKPSAHGPWVRFEDVAALLSQPEHQGDEAMQQASSMREDLACIRDEPVTGSEAEWIAWAREVAATRLSQSQRGYLRVKTIGALYNRSRYEDRPEIRESPSPPAPVLSDEERERLEKLAVHLDHTAEVARQEGHLVAATSREGCAAFLRNLASREHRGEEGCDHDFEPIEDSEHVTGNGYSVCRRCGALQAPDEVSGNDPISVGLTRDEAAHLLEKAALDGGFHSGCDKLRAALTNSEVQPPAGEIERLRELEALSEWIDHNTASSKRIREDASEQDRTRLTGIIDAYSYVQDRIDLLRRSAPSDSQGDQDCPYCENGRLPGVDRPCDNCGGSGKVPVRAQGDQEPAPTQVEGEVGYWDDADEAFAESAAGDIEQPEGGDEEGWPEAWLVRVANLIEPRAMLCLDQVAAEGWEKTGAEVRRYIPATSKDSSGLVEMAAKAITRANKAETERDANRADALANLDALEKHRQARVRAETALGDLAEEFEQEAKLDVDSADHLQAKGKDPADIERLLIRSDANAKAASLAREKAAELKEGEHGA